jgi:hypothetical protein
MTLPPHMDWALREIGVVPAKAPPPPPPVFLMPKTGHWYPNGDIPF